MRLLSFNIQHRIRERGKARRRRTKQCIRLIRELDPDLVCLQEVIPETWATIRKSLDPVFMECTPRRDGKTYGEAVPIMCLSKRCAMQEQHSFWFSETPDTPSVGWGAAHPRVCSVLRLNPPDPAEKCLSIYNLHLDHRSARARRESLGLLEGHLRNALARGDEVIVCGDFNMSAFHESIRSFLQRNTGLSDAVHLHPINNIKPTYLGWGWFNLARARIDLCLHSEQVKVTNYQAVTPKVDGRLVSDHRALVVDFSMEEG